MTADDKNNPPQDRIGEDRTNAKAPEITPSTVPRISTTPSDTTAKFGVAFKSEYIGQWAAKQENPFAEQNRKAAEKKAAQEATRKKAMPYIKIGSIAAACIAVLAVIIAIIVIINQPAPLPDDITLGSSGAAEVTESAQKVFDNYVNKLGDKTVETDEGPALTDEEMQGAIDAVSNYFQQQSNRTEDISTKINLVLIEMEFYGYKGQPEAIIKAAEGFNIDDMTPSQARQFLGILMGASYSVGNLEAGTKYAKQLSELAERYEADEGEKKDE